MQYSIKKTILLVISAMVLLPAAYAESPRLPGTLAFTKYEPITRARELYMADPNTGKEIFLYHHYSTINPRLSAVTWSPSGEIRFHAISDTEKRWALWKTLPSTRKTARISLLRDSEIGSVDDFQKEKMGPNFRIENGDVYRRGANGEWALILDFKGNISIYNRGYVAVVPSPDGQYFVAVLSGAEGLAGDYAGILPLLNGGKTDGDTSIHKIDGTKLKELPTEWDDISWGSWEADTILNRPKSLVN